MSANVTGDYSLAITPQSASQTFAYTLMVSQDHTAQLQPNQPLDLVLPRRGQNARLSFTSEAGDALSLQVAGQSTFPADRTVYYRVYKPDGSSLSSLGTSAFGAQELRLPVAGTYHVFVDSTYGETVTSRLTLAAGTAQAVDGDAQQVSTSHGGQATHATFQATAGQRLGIGIYDLALSFASYVGVAVYRPDGSTATSTSCHESNQGCKLSMTASMTGKHSVVITPQAANQTVAYKLMISQDVEGVLYPDQPQDVVLSRRGQNARFTFTGQAGQRLSLQVAGQLTAPAGRTVYYRIYHPDGTQWASTGTASYDAIRMAELPVSGDYTVVVDSTSGETLQARVTLASGSSALVLDGDVATVSTDIGGQEVFMSFAAKQGQRLGVGLSHLQVSSETYFSAVVYRPDGNSASATCYPLDGGCQIRLTANVDGLYRLYVRPASQTQQIQFTATVSTDVAGTLVRDTPLSLSLPRHGQNGWLSYDGKAGDSLTLHAAGQVTQPAGGNVYYVVYKPDGSSLTSVNGSGSTGLVLPLPALPVSGTYQVMVSPTYGRPLNVDVTMK